VNAWPTVSHFATLRICTDAKSSPSRRTNGTCLTDSTAAAAASRTLPHSNTKVDLLRKWFGRGLGNDPGFPLFATIAQRSPAVAAAIDDLLKTTHRFTPDALHELHHPHDPSESGWCFLGPIATVLARVTDALVEDSSSSAVTQCLGTVTALQRNKDTWTLAIKPSAPGASNPAGEDLVEVDTVVLATGALPRPLEDVADPRGTRVVPCEVALDLAQLASAVQLGETVGVIGNSHSGALVTMNLLSLGATPRVYAEYPVRLAQWECRPEQYVYSATGLKGIAAAFARHQLELASVGSPAPLVNTLPPEQLQIDLDNGVLDTIIPAMGYLPTTLPRIADTDSAEGVGPLARNAATSELEWDECRLPTDLFSLGIREPDYFEAPSQDSGRSPPGFGGPPCQREGMRGEKYVGINGMILRANHIVEIMASRSSRQEAARAHGNPQHRLVVTDRYGDIDGTHGTGTTPTDPLTT
jgi:hypothetical protein